MKEADRFQMADQLESTVTDGLRRRPRGKSQARTLERVGGAVNGRILTSRRINRNCI